MMVHASKASVGDYLGMDADYQSSDTYEGSCAANRQMTTCYL